MQVSSRPKRLFILVNPFGGKKSGRKIFHSEVKPLLVAAGILYTMQETEYQLHAQEIAYSMDLLKYDGIVCVSGDGILVEVVNGLLQREDWDTAIKVPLGIIPAGTGNGMAKSILDSAGNLYSISNATFAVIRGHKRALDVTTILQGEKKFFSVLMLTWGLVADIDIESEKYRWMGSARLDFYVFSSANNELEKIPWTCSICACTRNLNSKTLWFQQFAAPKLPVSNICSPDINCTSKSQCL